MKKNRTYFSWSQYSLWKSSKLSFYKKYCLGDHDLHLPAFDKGKEFADYRETGEIPHYVEDPLLAAVSKTIPRLDISEMKIEVNLGEIPLLSYIDECKEDLKEFAEFKTGRDPWNQNKVNLHEQLDFYATCIYLKSGEKIIPKCKLYWIETEEIIVLGEKKLMYTGVVETFERTFTEDEIISMAAKIFQADLDIKNYEHEEINLDEEFEEDLASRYIELLDEQKKIGNELDLIKLKMLDTLDSYGAKYISNDAGSFSLSVRKKAYYSKNINKLEADFKTKINKLKKIERDKNIVSYSETKSILFKKVKK